MPASIGLGVLCLVLSPVINQVVRLDSLGTAALVAFAAAPLTMMGAQAGILQGERRWIALAMIYIGAGVPRLVIGTVLIVWWPTEFAALLGVAIAAYVPVAVGWLALRRPRDPGEHPEEHSEEHRVRACGARPSTTPTRCSPSSPSPTSTSWSPATCSTSTRRACTPAA